MSISGENYTQLLQQTSQGAYVCQNSNGEKKVFQVEKGFIPLSFKDIVLDGIAAKNDLMNSPENARKVIDILQPKCNRKAEKENDPNSSKLYNLAVYIYECFVNLFKGLGFKSTQEIAAELIAELTTIASPVQERVENLPVQQIQLSQQQQEPQNQPPQQQPQTTNQPPRPIPKITEPPNGRPNGFIHTTPKKKETNYNQPPQPLTPYSNNSPNTNDNRRVSDKKSLWENRNSQPQTPVKSNQYVDDSLAAARNRAGSVSSGTANWNAQNDKKEDLAKYRPERDIKEASKVTSLDVFWENYFSESDEKNIVANALCGLGFPEAVNKEKEEGEFDSFSKQYKEKYNAHASYDEVSFAFLFEKYMSKNIIEHIDPDSDLAREFEMDECIKFKVSKPSEENPDNLEDAWESIVDLTKKGWHKIVLDMFCYKKQISRDASLANWLKARPDFTEDLCLDCLDLIAESKLVDQKDCNIEAIAALLDVWHNRLSQEPREFSDTIINALRILLETEKSSSHTQLILKEIPSDKDFNFESFIKCVGILLLKQDKMSAKDGRQRSIAGEKLNIFLLQRSNRDNLKVKIDINTHADALECILNYYLESNILAFKSLTMEDLVTKLENFIETNSSEFDKKYKADADTTPQKGMAKGAAALWNQRVLEEQLQKSQRK